MNQSLQPKFRGRILTSGPRRELLQKMVQQYVGDYVEIGTAYGSSAILAALANPEITVHCIDPMDGMYGTNQVDIRTGKFPTPELLEENCSDNGIEYGTRVVLHQQKHPPFPEAIVDHQFGVGYIDADHSREGCLQDYHGLRDWCQCLIFDNYEKGSVRWVVGQALKDGWEIEKEVSEKHPDAKSRVYRMIALKRKEIRS